MESLQDLSYIDILAAYYALARPDQIMIDHQVDKLQDVIKERQLQLGGPAHFGRGQGLELLAKLGIWLGKVEQTGGANEVESR